jgi:hypothetical protein
MTEASGMADAKESAAALRGPGGVASNAPPAAVPHALALTAT